MQGIMKLSGEWWFGALIGAITVTALLGTALTTGVSFEAAGVEISLDNHKTAGLQLRVIAPE